MAVRRLRKKWQRLKSLRAGRDTPDALVGPQYWRERASSARAKIAPRATGRSTQRLRRLADSYDRLADRLQQDARLTDVPSDEPG